MNTDENRKQGVNEELFHEWFMGVLSRQIRVVLTVASFCCVIGILAHILLFPPQIWMVSSALLFIFILLPLLIALAVSYKSINHQTMVLFSSLISLSSLCGVTGIIAYSRWQDFAMPYEGILIIIIGIGILANLNWERVLAITCIGAMFYISSISTFTDTTYTRVILEALFIISFCCLSTFMAYRVERLFRVEFQHRETLRELSETDPLTGLLNRRGFEKCYQLVMRNNSRYEQHAAFILIDVDYFKAFNDTYGHQAGDDALVRIAETLQTFARRPLDACARMGGEEFCLLLNDVNLELLPQLGQRICNSIADLKISHRESKVAEVITISLGMTNMSSEMDFSKIYRIADHALYTAKDGGRNNLVWVPSEPITMNETSS